jgi:uncharacterized protein (TIGR02996 family)
MEMEGAFLKAIHDQPAEEASWLVLADWLEEQNQPERAELVRLHVQLRTPLKARARGPLQRRAVELLAAGFRPAVPVLTNSIGMSFVLIPPGSFLMGSLKSESLAHQEEMPRRMVRISRPFYFGLCQVTQGQLVQVLGRNRSLFQLGHPACAGVDISTLPAEGISYTDVSRFCRTLAALPAEQEAGRVYRAPSEAEWEYACRAGSTTPFHTGNTLPFSLANCDGEAYDAETDWEDPFIPTANRTTPVGRTMPVGSYPPNLFGLHDLHGNVWEWCRDWFDPGYYCDAPSVDPTGPPRGQRRVLRGGGWSTGKEYCRSAQRGHNTVGGRYDYNGFRVAFDALPRTRRRRRKADTA